MRLAHLKCPNCDGFVDFNDEQGLFCKNCGSELMVSLDPEDLELEELKAMPEILSDRYIYERKLYESELRQDEERNKERLAKEWKQNRPLGTRQQKKKSLVIFYVVLGVVILFMMLGGFVIGIMGSLKSGMSQLKREEATKVNVKGLVKVEQEMPDTAVDKFALFRRGYPNSLDDITYCMKAYLENVDGKGYWDSIEFINAYMGNDGNSSDLVCVFEEKSGPMTVYRAVCLNDITYDPNDHAIVTDMDFHLAYHAEGDLKGAYYDIASLENGEVKALGKDVVTYR